MENINDNGGLELIGIPKCIEVKMEDSDIEADVPEKVVAESIGNTERNVIIKDEDEGILTEYIDDWSLIQTTQDTTNTTSVETMKMECPDESVFEETKFDIKLENTIFKDKDMPDSFDMRNDVIGMAIKQEELTIKSENEDFYEDNINHLKRILDSYPHSRSTSKFEDESTSNCSKHDLEIKHDSHLKSHRKRNENNALLSCSECGYQAKYKSNLRTHMLRHKSPADIEMFSCEECDYQAKVKHDLKKHMLRHKGATEIEMFSCNECDFQTKYRYSLKLHKRVHKSPSEIEMFCCEECDYQSKVKADLRKHMWRHKNPSEIEMFSCGECDYQSRVKADVKEHMLRHKGPSEIEMLNCGECDFQTKYKRSLRRHKLVHKTAT